MKKLLRAETFSKVVPVLLMWSAMVFASKPPDPFQQTETAMHTAARVVYYLIALVVAVLALGPFVFGSIMGYKSYQQAKEAREGNPTTAGIKAFALWVLITGLISFFAYYFIDKILGGSLDQIVSDIITTIGKTAVKSGQ